MRWTYNVPGQMALDVTLPARRVLEVRPVGSKQELDTFIKLPWRLYRNEPNWVAPLLMDLKKRLDQRKNPFFKHAEAQYFLAWRDGRAVDRCWRTVGEQDIRVADRPRESSSDDTAGGLLWALVEHVRPGAVGPFSA